MRFWLMVCVLMAAAGVPVGWAAPATPLVVAPISDSQTVVLAGNTRPETRSARDLGALAADARLDHMELVLNRPPAREAALRAAIAAMETRGSGTYHQWLTPAAFGAEYGPAESDLAAVTSWLAFHGFAVNAVAPGRTMIDFSGTAGAVDAAFHTSMHVLSVAGVRHIANMTDPSIPAALAGVVRGVASLNDFRPHPEFRNRSQYTFKSTEGTTEHAVVPADLATIYDLNPLFAAGISGQEQTVVVIEDTNLHAASDWLKFRAVFGLSVYQEGSLTALHPASSGVNNCSNPGAVPESEEEAQLDAEWASAAAPNAAIVVASCSDSETTFGGLIALQNLINGATPPAIVSISYGECESSNGAAANAAFETTYQQAAAEGTSVFVAAGDEGAASCDADLPASYEGIAVSGFASTPYDVAVGGTDFGDTYAGTTADYWYAANNRQYGSAKSYIPEIPWNDSCASQLIARSQGYARTYGLTGFCNSVIGIAEFLSTAAGSGGPSGCATGSGPVTGGVGGSCMGYAKPSWQKLVGVPADGVRDMPDVSLFAANGVFDHYYLLCDSDVLDEGDLCKGPPSGWAGAGGTSFASPIMAAIQSLVNQKAGGAQGDPDPEYYALAAQEYGATGSAACNSSAAGGAAGSCLFHDVTEGDMDVNCVGTDDCFTDAGLGLATLGVNGVLSTQVHAYAKAYGATTGWDFATGIGTVDAANLVNGWPSSP